ncbi:MAG: phosphoribosyltransferase family protein [Candidatus ainarchaeum sp.]|nr:phosphoribosyltransferase family protein [Candidatus ainarchaeum sp.]
MGTIKVSWKEIETACRHLAKKLEKNNYEAVVCIASGGLVPGKLLSELLQLPLGIVVSKRYNKNNCPDKKSFFDANVKWCCENAEPKKILLVDDLVDEGKTMEQIIGSINAKALIPGLKTIDIAVIYYKNKNSSLQSRQKVHYYKTTENWIIFPWELQQGKKSQ